VEFSIITNSGNKSRERIASMIQQDLKAIGIRMTIVTLDFPSLIERITSSFNYELCLLGVVVTDMDPNGQGSVLLSSGSGHAWNPNQKAPATDWEAEIDRLMATTTSSPDQAKRKAAFDQVQKIMADQGAILYLANRHGLVAASPKLGNFEPAILWPQTLWNADRLYLKP
jgi:peptide/nickel transport system substrate-binding protein